MGVDDIEKDVAAMRAYMQKQHRITQDFITAQRNEERRIREVTLGKKLRLRAAREKANAQRIAARERAMREDAQSYATPNTSGIVSKAIGGARRRRKISTDVSNPSASDQSADRLDRQLRETSEDSLNEES